MRLSCRAKVTKIAAYKRKRFLLRNKIWLLTVGMVAVLASTGIYFGEELTQYVQYVNEQMLDHHVNLMPYPYS